MTQLALIGAGPIGRRYAEAIERIAGVDVTCIVDPSADANVFASERGMRWAGSTADMLTGPLPHGAIIASQDALTGDDMLALIAAGIPTLIYPTDALIRQFCDIIANASPRVSPRAA